MYQLLDEVMDLIRPGQNLFIQTGAAAPQELIRGLMEKAGELNNMTIYQMHTEGKTPYVDLEWQDVFKVNCFFIGSNLRGESKIVPFLKTGAGVVTTRANQSAPNS